MLVDAPVNLASASHLRPRDMRMASLRLRRHPAPSLRDDLEAPRHGVQCEVVVAKRRISTSRRREPVPSEPIGRLGFGGRAHIRVERRAIDDVERLDLDHDIDIAAGPVVAGAREPHRAACVTPRAARPLRSHAVWR